MELTVIPLQMGRIVGVSPTTFSERTRISEAPYPIEILSRTARVQAASHHSCPICSLTFFLVQGLTRKGWVELFVNEWAC